MANNGDANCNAFAKTICSICYQDFKPLIEDLQSISVCGHVFHELCLHQWFEDSSNVKKRSCPVCKQTCTNADVGRLYFQYVGETNESGSSQKPREYGENEELRRVVNMLEEKLFNMVSTLEQQQKEFKEVKDQLLSCKDQLKAEVALKTEAVTQMETSQELLRMKSLELDKSTLECVRLQEKSMDLAKELAALKLASDLDLKEDEITKLTSFENDIVGGEAIGALRKSLVIRNKGYKEVMAICKTLERREARRLKKLEKANNKIEKLKLRVQELKTAFEIKENEVLRMLKDQDSKFKRGSHENTMKRYPCKPSSRLSTMDNNLPEPSTDDRNKKENFHSLNEDENIRSSTSDNNLITKGYHAPMTDACLDAQNEVEMPNSCDKDGVSCFGSVTKLRKKGHNTKPSTDAADDDDDVICYDTKPVQSSVQTRSKTPTSGPGENCFSGGLMGPDGTNWHLGKWCKKAKGSNAGQGSLTAVGADVSGGQINAMQPLEQSSLGSMDSLKTSKVIMKPSKLQPVGHFDVDS